jgi:hypothetical protein
MNRRWYAALLLAALALVVAGCGGDDGGDSASSDTAVVETESSDDGSTETESSDDAMETDTAEDDGMLGGECAEFAGLGAKLQNAFGGTSGDDIDSVAEVFDELADRVPEEIRDDYQVLADNFKEFADALEGVDLSSGATPDAETLAKLQAAVASMDQPEVQQASENIEAWATENC